jgi:hypothetical membrane protein
MINFRSVYLPVGSALLAISRRLRIPEACLLVQARLVAISRRLNIHSVLALAGILGPLALIGGDLAAALSTPGYSLVRDSISSLAFTSFGWLQTIGFLTLGLLVEIYTAGLLYNIKHARWCHLGIGLFAFFGFAMLLIGAFHTDPVGGPTTFEGAIHGFTARTVFSLFTVAALALAPSIKKDPGWQPLFRYTIATAILAVILAVVLRFFPEKTSWFGLIERILVANMVLWVEVTAINLFRLSLKRNKAIHLDLHPKTG